MDKKDFYFLGKITKTSGYKGNLMFFLDVDEISYYKELAAVFIEVSNELIPFAIQTLQIKNNRIAIAKLEDVDNEDQAIALVGCELFLPLSFLPALTGNQFYYHEVTGFVVTDINYGYVGVIDHILDQSSQALFVIQSKGKEILIPITDEIIKEVDRQKKQIEVETPEGLIDLYL
jgi:16S rRNA processing protein RimM